MYWEDRGGLNLKFALAPTDAGLPPFMDALASSRGEPWALPASKFRRTNPLPELADLNPQDVRLYPPARHVRGEKLHAFASALARRGAALPVLVDDNHVTEPVHRLFIILRPDGSVATVERRLPRASGQYYDF